RGRRQDRCNSPWTPTRTRHVTPRPGHLPAPLRLRRPPPARRRPGAPRSSQSPRYADRVDIGDPEGVADRRIRGRPPALTVDVLGLAERGDVHDQEEAGAAELRDGVQFVVELPLRVRVLGAGRWVRVPYRARAPCAVRRRSHLISVCPAPTSQGGNRGVVAAP